MNYIAETNDFYLWLGTHPLSPNAVLLWHGLMHTNNSCFWKKEFTVSLQALALTMGGVSVRTAERARAELTEKGLLKWRKGVHCNAAVYTLNSVVHLRRSEDGHDEQREKDVVSDAEPDVIPDAILDVIPDVILKTIPDAIPDVIPDAIPDAITSYTPYTRKTKTKQKHNDGGAPPRAPAPSSIDACIDAFTEDGPLRAALREWAAIRRGMRKPLTAHAVTLALDRLKTLAADDHERRKLVDKAVLYNWLNFYPDDERGEGSYANTGKGSGPRESRHARTGGRLYADEQSSKFF